MKSVSTLSFMLTFIRLSAFHSQDINEIAAAKGTPAAKRVVGSKGTDLGILSILKGNTLKSQADKDDIPIEAENVGPDEVEAEDDNEIIEGASVQEAENRKYGRSGRKYNRHRGYCRRHTNYDSNCSDNDSYEKDYNHGYKQKGIYRRDVAEAENYHKNGHNWYHPSHHRGGYGSGCLKDGYGDNWRINNYKHAYNHGYYHDNHINGIYRRDTSGTEDYGHNGHHRGGFGWINDGYGNNWDKNYRPHHHSSGYDWDKNGYGQYFSHQNGHNYNNGIYRQNVEYNGYDYKPHHHWNHNNYNNIDDYNHHRLHHYGHLNYYY